MSPPSSEAPSPADRKTGVVAGGLVKERRPHLKTPARQQVSVGANSIVGGSPASTAARSCSRPRPGRSPPPAGLSRRVRRGESGTSRARRRSHRSRDRQSRIIGGFVGTNFGSIDGSSSAAPPAEAPTARSAASREPMPKSSISRPGRFRAQLPRRHDHQFHRHRRGHRRPGQHGRSVHRAEQPDLRVQPAGVSVDPRRLQQPAVRLPQHRHPADGRFAAVCRIVAAAIAGRFAAAGRRCCRHSRPITRVAAGAVQVINNSSARVHVSSPRSSAAPVVNTTQAASGCRRSSSPWDRPVRSKGSNNCRSASTGRSSTFRRPPRPASSRTRWCSRSPAMSRWSGWKPRSAVSG